MEYYIILTISILLNIILSVFSLRAFSRINELEEIFEKLHSSVELFKTHIESLLNRSIYASDETVIKLIYELKNLYDVLKNVDDIYKFFIDVGDDHPYLDESIKKNLENLNNE